MYASFVVRFVLLCSYSVIASCGTDHELLSNIRISLCTDWSMVLHLTLTFIAVELGNPAHRRLPALVHSVIIGCDRCILSTSFRRLISLYLNGTTIDPTSHENMAPYSPNASLLLLAFRIFRCITRPSGFSTGSIALSMQSRSMLTSDRDCIATRESYGSGELNTVVLRPSVRHASRRGRRRTVLVPGSRIHTGSRTENRDESALKIAQHSIFGL